MYTTLIISCSLCKQDVFPQQDVAAASALAAAARREKEANLTKLLDEFGIHHEDARTLAAAGVRTVEDLIILDEEDLEGLSLSLSLSVVNKKKLIKGVHVCACVRVCVRAQFDVAVVNKKMMTNGMCVCVCVRACFCDCAI
jgi:hypothetical protein